VGTVREGTGELPQRGGEGTIGRNGCVNRRWQPYGISYGGSYQDSGYGLCYKTDGCHVGTLECQPIEGGPAMSLCLFPVQTPSRGICGPLEGGTMNKIRPISGMDQNNRSCTKNISLRPAGNWIRPTGS